MKIISTVSGKGGVGKTGSTVNIATCLSNEGYKVLLIDIDKQSNATKYLGFYNPSNKSVSDIIIDKLEPSEVIQKTKINNLDIIPASYVPLEEAPNQILLDVNRSRMNRMKAIQSLDYDFVLIDCPPDLGIITMNALAITDYVIVPINIDEWALEGFKIITDKMQIVRDEFNPKLKLLGAFITLDEYTKLNNKIKSTLSKQLGDKFLNSTIRRSVRFKESTFAHIPVVNLFPEENVSKDYVNLTKEVLENVK